jgi:amidase
VEEAARIASFIPYTAQFNLTGQPAVSLPLH